MQSLGRNGLNNNNNQDKPKNVNLPRLDRIVIKGTNPKNSIHALP
jgi:hypothetical protein